MPRAKKTTTALSMGETEPVLLRRSTRKRTTVNYAEAKKKVPVPHGVMRSPPRDRSKKGKVGAVEAIEAVEAAVETLVETAGAITASNEPDENKLPSTYPAKKAKEPVKEKRMKPFRASPPKNFQSKMDRALSQPIAIIRRRRCGSHGSPEEVFDMRGSEGLRYVVHIRDVPKCTCKDFVFRKQACKHIIYVLHYALKVPQDSKLLYQQSFTSPELRDMLNDKSVAPGASAEDLYRDGKRKLIEGDCPVCYMEFDSSKESIVYCRATCGNNIHADCMRIWIDCRQGSYKPTCPLCRCDWDVRGM